MCAMQLVFALVGYYSLDPRHTGHSKVPGAILIGSTCIFMLAFAMTWAPLSWLIVSELYPGKHRAPCMALATSANWFFNFLIALFTTFIIQKIGPLYNIVFGICCAAMLFTVYFYLIESKDHSLEEVNEMYEMRIPPRHSAKWRRSDRSRAVELVRLKDTYNHKHGRVTVEAMPTFSVPHRTSLPDISVTRGQVPESSATGILINPQAAAVA